MLVLQQMLRKLFNCKYNMSWEVGNTSWTSKLIGTDFMLPQRIIFCYFSLLAIINAYMMRLCLDFSLNRIVMDCKLLPTMSDSLIEQSKKAKTSQSPTWLVKLAAKLNDTLKTIQTQKASQMPPIKSHQLLRTKDPDEKCAHIWTWQVKSFVSSAFYLGYMLTHIPGGRLAERYGGKWVLGLSILLAAILTLLTPAAVRIYGPLGLIAIRLLIGLCEGPTFPAVSTMLAQWVPAKERGLLGSCVLSGGEIGITMVELVIGILMQQDWDQHWSITFYVVGAGAVLWFLGYATVCSSKPDACPYIQREERDYIKRAVSETLVIDVPPTPWRSIIMSAPIWVLASATMQYNWNYLTLAYDIQAVVKELKGSSLWEALEASMSLTLPYLCNWVASVIMGSLSDFLISKHILSRTATRRIMACAAVLALVSASLYLVVYNDKSWRRLSIVLSTGAYYAGCKLLPLDMSPNYAGTLMGIANGLGALPGLLLPYLRQLEYGCDQMVVSTIRAGLWLISVTYISGDVQFYNHVHSTSNQNN